MAQLLTRDGPQTQRVIFVVMRTVFETSRWSTVSMAASAAGERLVYRRLEASHVLDRHVLAVARLHVLVQDGEDLVVEDLESADSVHHLL